MDGDCRGDHRSDARGRHGVAEQPDRRRLSRSRRCARSTPCAAIAAIFHIHDEAYEYFTYAPARHFSPGSLPDAAGHTISLYSLSKAYGMASWRVGYMVVPEVLAEAINKIQDTLLICPPAASQRAALAALAVGAAYPGRHLAQLDRCDTRSSRR